MNRMSYMIGLAIIPALAACTGNGATLGSPSPIAYTPSPAATSVTPATAILTNVDESFYVRFPVE